MTDPDLVLRDAQARAVAEGRTALGIELGSTRIKACLVDAAAPSVVLATGSSSWENAYVDGLWTYPLPAVWAGLQAAYADLVDQVECTLGVVPERFGAIGVSAMMHGYLALDAAGDLLVPFRTWRNTSTARAAAELTELFGVNIPLRWSVAHLRHAELDREEHVARIASLTTLAGHVHHALTGRRVLGVGDASGMFPIDPVTHDYDTDLLARYDALDRRAAPSVRTLLPDVLVAGQDAGSLTSEGAALLDPSGRLRPGSRFAPPEGDAGTGMVATHAIAPRTGNVSAGTSIFAMVVLERGLARLHPEVDVVTTPVGDPVAMVHCNNGASELDAWAGLLGRFAEAAGAPVDADEVFAVLLREALDADSDAGGVLAYNTLAGEPVVGLAEGRPLVVRAPGSAFTLANFARAQLYGMFGTLSLGMRVLQDEGVEVDRLYAHGGVFRTAGVAQRMLAAALDAPVAVGATAAEGGAWGMAVLAAFTAAGGGDLSGFLTTHVFGDAADDVAHPDPADVAGFAAWLDQWQAGLSAVAAAAAPAPLPSTTRSL